MIHSPTTAFVKWFLCVVWFQRLTVTHSLTTAFVKWLLYVVWFQRLTVIHSPTTAFVKWFLCVVWFQRLTVTHSPTTAIGSPCPSPIDTFTHYCLCQMASLCCVVSEIDSDTFTHYCLCQMASLCCVVSEIDSDTFTHYCHRFSMPQSQWPMSADKLWYSFNVGPAHFTRQVHLLLMLHAQICLLVRFGHIFVHLNFETMKIGKFPPEYDHKYLCTSFAVHLFSSPEYAQFWVFGGTRLTTCHCCSVSFCVALSVVLALNSQAIQSKACVSAVKYEHSPFFWKPC